MSIPWKIAAAVFGLLGGMPALERPAHAGEPPNCRPFLGRWVHQKMPQVLLVSPDCRVELNECGVSGEVLAIQSGSDLKFGKVDVRINEVKVNVRPCPVPKMVSSCTFKRVNAETIEWDCPVFGLKGPFDRVDE